MSGHPVSLDRMLAVWNLRELEALPARLREVLAEGVVFIDPTIVTTGLAEFEANVRDFRRRYPEAVIERSSAVDSHHNLHRYHWEITVQGRRLVAGFDVSETDAQGKVCRVLGFFGPLAPSSPG
jgi:hypothetical protein